MTSLKLIIPVTPKPKASVRLSARGGAYNPSATGMKLTRGLVQKFIQENPEKAQFLPLKGPLLAIVHYRIPAALKTTVPRRKKQHLLPHVARPDGDNLEKFLNDALNGLVWTDDSRISWLLRSKSITSAKTGETVLYISEVGNTPPDYESIINQIIENIKIDELDSNILQSMSQLSD